MIVDKFGLVALRAAFYNPSDQVTKNVISNYTKVLISASSISLATRIKNFMGIFHTN